VSFPPDLQRADPVAFALPSLSIEADRFCYSLIPSRVEVADGVGSIDQLITAGNTDDTAASLHPWLLLDSSVKEVTEKTILLNDGSSIDDGLAVWAAGNGPLPLTLNVIEKLGEQQSKHKNVARGRIATDPWMRAEGSEGSILAFGDCSCIMDGPDGPLPATAQDAAQQGEYFAKLMSEQYDLCPRISVEGVFLPPIPNPDKERRISDAIVAFATQTVEYAKPFQFLNLGILAYTGGGSALAQVSPAPGVDPIKGTGKVGNALWKSVYLTKQVSMRNRVLVLNDWIKRQIFGRDITRL
jgi:NADH dehydrogenase FAD-containing subunit